MPATRFAKITGEAGECAFIWEATRRGLIVSKPYGESAPYDFIVQPRERGLSGRPGRLSRIQVKAAATFQRANRCYQVAATKSRGHARYAGDEIDFFAVVILPLAVWYIIPVSIVTTSALFFFPHVQRSRSRYAKYREAWYLLFDLPPV